MVKRRSRRTPSSTPADACLLLYADTERSADQRYFAGFHVPDPFIAMRIRNRKIGVFGALEFGRARKESSLDEVLSFEEWQEKARKQLDCEEPKAAEVVVVLARRHRVKRFVVSPDFPYGLAQRLTDSGLRLEIAEDTLLPEREIKTAEEARAIAEGNRCSALGLAAAGDALRRAVVRGGRLILDGRPLTSERVREAIDLACLRAGAIASHTIVAGGDQACDPHCVGHGVLRSGELIIVDTFPRVSKTGYHGDMTRTFLKGAPTDAQAKLVATVHAAQKTALAGIRAGRHGRDVHQRVVDFFSASGYKTRRDESGSIGFFHGTGHGLGLEVHELPRMGRTSTPLREGAVVTVEPGLYYPGLGGCRIEDVVQVTKGKPRMLSQYSYDWIV